MASALPLAWPEAPQVDDAIYPDDYLDFWADRYVAGGYLYRGVTLLQLLARPYRYENDEQYADPAPLLGRQRRVQARLIAAEAQAHSQQLQRDGEPLDLAWGSRR